MDLDLRRGEVHALLGENGAGKTTLMNVLYGMYRPDEGEILINGQPMTIHSPQDAIPHGIGMVHQHFMLIPVMTVAENIMLGNEPNDGRGSSSTTARRRSRVKELAQSFGFAIDPEARIQDISVGQQQRVEILKALYRTRRHPDPRRAHGRADAAGGERALRDPGTLMREGMSVIFISHKLHEVLEIADRISVLRRGKLVETVPREGATEQGLARLMVGREVVLQRRQGAGEPGRAPARGRGRCRAVDDRGLPAVRGVPSTFARARSWESRASTATDSPSSSRL